MAVDYSVIAAGDIQAPANPYSGIMPTAPIPLSQMGPGFTGPKDRSYSVGQHLAFAIPGTALAAVDTVGRSVGLLSEGSTEKFAASMDPDGFGAYYTDNKAGLGLAADLATALIPGYYGAKAVQAGSWLYKGLAKAGVSTRALNTAFASAEEGGAALKAVMQADLLAATTARQTVFNVASNPVRAKLVGDAVRTGLLDASKKYVGSEVAMLATMNASENLYPSDMSVPSQLMMHAAGLGISGAIETAFIKASIRRNLRTPEIKDATAAARNALGLETAPSTAGNRDYAITVAALSAGEQKATAAAAVTAGDTQLAQNAGKLATSWEIDVKNEVTKLAGDSVKGVPLAADEASIRSFMGAVLADPTIAPGVKAFGDLPATVDDYTKLAGAVNAVTDNLERKLERSVDTIMRASDINARMRNQRKGVTATAARSNLISDINAAFAKQGDLSTAEFQELVNTLNESSKTVFQNMGNIPLDKEVTRRLKLLNRTADAMAAVDDAQKGLAAYRSLSTYVVEPDGHMVLASERRLRFHDTNHPPIGQLAREGAAVESLYGPRGALTDPISGEAFKVAVSGDLIPQLAAGKAFHELPHYQQSAYNAVGQHIVEHWKPGSRKPGQLVNLTEDSSAWSLDLAAHVLKKHPTAVSDFNLPLAAHGREVEWLAEKAIEKKYDTVFVPLMDRFVKEAEGGLVGGANKLTLEDMRYALNLPGKSYGSESPLFQVFRSIYTQGDRTLAEAGITAKDLNKLMAAEVAGGTPVADASMSLVSALPPAKYPTVGRNFNELRDRTSGNFLKAQIAIKEPAPFNLFQQSMNSYAVGRQMEYLEKFNTAPDAIRELFQNIMQTSAFEVARAGVTTLAEGQQASKGVFTYQNMATRGIDVFTAADNIAGVAENHASRWVKKLFEQEVRPGVTHSSTLLQLRRPENKGSLFSLEQFRSVKQYGFELEAGTVETAPGLHSFVLKGTEEGGLSAKNVAAWKKLFGPDAPLPEGETLLPMLRPGIRGMDPETVSPLQLDQLAVDGLKSISSVMDTLFESTNFFKGLHGKSQVAYQNWYLPPPSLEGKLVKYIIMPGEEGTGAAAKYVLYDTTTTGLAKQMEHPTIQDLLKQGGRAIDQAEMARQFDLRDQAFFNLLDFSDSIAQTGRGTGALGKPRVDYGVSVLDDLVQSAESHILSLSKRTVASLFVDQLSYARHMDAMSGLVKGEASIWQQWANRLLGNRATTGTKGPLDSITKAASSMFDTALETTKQTLQSLTPSTGGISRGTQKDFQELKAALGGRLPYSDVAEFAENTFKVSRNTSLEDVAYGLNSATANLALRIFEVGNAAISLVGNIVSIPLVVNAMRRGAHPTEEAWRAATGLMGHEIPNSDVAMPNAARLMTKAMSYLWTKEGNNMLSEARAIGGLRGTVAEVMKDLHMPMESPFQNNARKVIDAVSFISDRGEDLARSWAYSAGYLIARDAYQMTRKADMHAVAQMFADNAIANFRHANKPMLFQGAIGAPLGLFQTYMWNYYGRMFQYIENKNYRALAINYAMQGAVFGLESVPGWQQVNSMYQSAYSGDRDLIDGLDANYGRAASDWILHGTVSNLPKVFGKDGISLYSRGDANITRVPAFVSPANAPIVSIAENTAGLLGETLNMFKSGGTPTAQRTVEIMGTYAPNRPLSRVMEIMAGVSVDKRGAVIADDTRNAMSVVSRVMGMRPMAEMEAIKANARNQTNELYQQDVHKRLQTNLRAAFRGNLSPEKMDDVVSDAIMQHLKAGGAPSSAGEYIKNAAIAASINRNDRELMTLMRNPSRYNEVLRLLNNTTNYREE